MNDEISTPDTTEEIPSTPETTEVDSSQGEGQASETVTQPSQTETFDPTQVPEELKPLAKQLQADYTRKTQAIAEQRKQADEWKAQAEQFQKYQQYVPILEEMLGKGQQTISQPEMAALEADLKQRGYSDEAIEMMKVGAGFVLNQFNQRETQRSQDEAKVKEQAQLESSVKEAETVDPRLADASLTYQSPDGTTITFGQIVADYVKSDPNWTKDPVSAAKRAIGIVDALIGKAKTEGKEELSASAKGKAARFPNISSSPVSAGDVNSAPQSMKEAAEQAKKELGM